ncbi:hypothetical protein THAOC_01284 [Thalassiosira oceanica]|uniref:Uncharacterized protein n=1 Tax=Thalassiosira oceanica TaxID=159749 RepID=K0TIN9_THAOC|nr:hypothetical protein THAOC_01284 [Thalassiosira oceanica]|eukprot:EJK76924.1 hypothetical protein THAOC_01284 [Thalassiosira oceanica]
MQGYYHLCPCESRYYDFNFLASSFHYVCPSENSSAWSPGGWTDTEDSLRLRIRIGPSEGERAANKCDTRGSYDLRTARNGDARHFLHIDIVVKYDYDDYCNRTSLPMRGSAYAGGHGGSSLHNTMKKMCLKDFPSLQATIAAVRVKHQNGDWDKFMEDCLLHISRHELEANAGSKPFPRTIAQVSPDKRKREAGDDEGEEVEEILCDGVDCSDYLVLSSGKLAVPDRVWNRSSVQFRVDVNKFNRAVDKHNASVRRRVRKKKQEDEDAHSDDDKDGGGNAKDRKIQALVARVEALEEERTFEAKCYPTPDWFQNFSDRLADTTCHDVSAKLSAGFQLLREVG